MSSSSRVYSLQKSLTRRLLVNMLIVMCGLLIIANFSVRQILQDYIVTRLQHDAESIVSALEYDGQGQWHLSSNRMSSVYDRVRSGHYFRIDTKDQLITSRSLFDEDFPVATQLANGPNSYVAQGIGAETWLVWFQQVNKRGSEIRILVAEDMTPIQQQILEYTVYAFLLVLLMTGVLIYLQQRSLNRSFLIFELLRKNLSSIRHKEINALGIKIPEEITPLTMEIENLIDQLRHRIERTRHAIGNLAHELKRPVQLLSIQRDEGAENLNEPLEEIKSIIYRELRRAKISGARDAGGEFKPAEELPVLIGVMEKIYPHIRIILKQPDVGKRLDLDRDDLLELVGNLLDNACKFASQEVHLGYTQKNQHLKLTIEDDGPGLDEPLLENIINRGVRLDENVQGHGFGLNICKDILDSYQGKMSFSRSSLGGLKVNADIPVG
jgi:signal transduction histidine kinase